MAVVEGGVNARDREERALDDAPDDAGRSAESRQLIEAALTVMARRGYEGTTVAAILEEAGLGTRAFYRHFDSKDELLLALYDHDARAAAERLRARLDRLSGPRERLEAWVDEALGLAHEPRRARRTRVLAAEAAPLSLLYPERFAEIVAATLRPLEEVLTSGRADGTFPDAVPPHDARSIYALVWSTTQARLEGDTSLGRHEAFRHVLRYCLPALGVTR